MKLYLTESQFAKIILVESQESKSISASKKLLMNSLGYSEEQADHTVRIDIRSKIENLREPDAAKFILGVTRMFVDGELEDGNTCNKLNKTLKLVASEAHINEYNRNLNDLSAEELISRFADAERDFNNQRRAEVDKLTFNSPSKYKIVRIDSYEQASKYGKYTSWCVTHGKGAFDDYTQHGINQFYFCLRQGFENEREQVGLHAPLDDYGLSMLAVCVYPDGDLKTCTCRWNHDKGGNDNVMNEIEVSKAVGVNFYKTFLPNTKFKDAVEDAQRRLEDGERPENVFELVRDKSEDMTAVRLFGAWNFIDKDGHYLFKKWFEDCWPFREGYASVQLNGKRNFIDKDGHYLFKTWFDDCGDFREGYAAVELNYKWNFIGKDGHYLFKTWFEYCGGFCEGYAAVMPDDKWNFIDKDGHYLFKKWFEDCGCFSEGYTAVQLNGEWNFIDKDGHYLFKKWFDYCGDFREEYAAVKLNGRWNFIGKDSHYLSDTWFDCCGNFREGYAKVRLGGKWNFIGKDSRYLSKTWFDDCGGFSEGYAAVQLNGKWCKIDRQGKLH